MAFDERDLDVISDRLPKNAAALTITNDGEVAFIIPQADDDDIVPEPVIAIIELALRLQDGDLTIRELVEAFRQRDKS